MKIRLALSLNITRAAKPEPQGELIFEHRDTDSSIESTYGGDQRLHRMGFTPNSDPEEE